jgi:hypothetical protein
VRDTSSGAIVGAIVVGIQEIDAFLLGALSRVREMDVVFWRSVCAGAHTEWREVIPPFLRGFERDITKGGVHLVGEDLHEGGQSEGSVVLEPVVVKEREGRSLLR